MTSGTTPGRDPVTYPTLSVVVPCYRSARTLPLLVDRLRRVLGDLGAAYEVILVVDGSPADAWTVARTLSREHAEVEAIRLSRNFGQQNALLAGIRHARHDVVVTIDDDLQHRPEDLPVLLAALTDDVDLVYGVASEQGHGLARGLATRIGGPCLPADSASSTRAT